MEHHAQTQKRGLSLAPSVNARPLKRAKTDDSGITAAMALVQNPLLAFSPFAASAETPTYSYCQDKMNSVSPSPSEHDVFDGFLDLDSDYSLSEDYSSDEAFATLDASSMEWEMQSPRSLGLPSMDIELADLLTQECPLVPREVGVPKLPGNRQPKTMKKPTVHKPKVAAGPPPPRPITSKADCPACRGKHRAHTCLEHGHRARNNYGRVASGDRCGECTNCLRPHWKKRCLNLSPDKFCEHGYVRIGVGGLGAGCLQCRGTTAPLQDSRGRPIVKPMLCEPAVPTPRIFVMAGAPEQAAKPPAVPAKPQPPSVLEAALEIKPEPKSVAAAPPAPVVMEVMEVQKAKEVKTETASTPEAAPSVEISDKKEAHRLEITFKEEAAPFDLGRGKRSSTRRSYAYIEAC